jgi:hypothetical protein
MVYNGRLHIDVYISKMAGSALLSSIARAGAAVATVVCVELPVHLRCAKVVDERYLVWV